MKTTKIFDLMKKRHSLTLIRHNDDQYITDSISVYCISQLPHLSPSQLLTMMGIDEEKQEDYTVTVTEKLPKYLEGILEDAQSGPACDESAFTAELILGGKVYSVIDVEGSAALVPKAYLKPFDGDEIIMRYSRQTNTVTVSAGFFFLGAVIIQPLTQADQAQLKVIAERPARLANKE